MRFEWDEDKALANSKKHRVTFEKAQQVFDDPRAVPFEDLKHSTDDETRYVMIGSHQSAGCLFHLHTGMKLCDSSQPAALNSGW